MSTYCFTYGSLMCGDIMSQVAGTLVQGERACLRDHVRHPVKGEDYPGMVPAAGGCVEGVLYKDLPEHAWPRLDAFEGEQYERLVVQVTLSDGRVVASWTYVFRSEWGHLLLPGDWDFASFLDTGKARFQARYLGFGRL